MSWALLVLDTREHIPWTSALARVETLIRETQAEIHHHPSPQREDSRRWSPGASHTGLRDEEEEERHKVRRECSWQRPEPRSGGNQT